MLPAGKSISDAKALRVQRIEEIRTGRFVAPTTTTFGEYARSWLQTSKRNADHQSQTTRGYEAILRVQLEPRIGVLTMQALAEPVVGHMRLEGLLRELYDRGSIRKDDNGENRALSYERVRHARKLLSAVFKRAEKEGVVSVDPMRHTRMPKRRMHVDYVERVDQTLTREQLRSLIAATREKVELNFLHLGVVLGGVCGLRIAEVLGLRARDVNASARTISIRQTVEPHYDRTAEKGQRVVLRFKEPKSERSRRTIDDVPAEVFEALDFHLSNVRADRPIGDALLITRPDGSTWSPDGFGKRYVKAARSLGLGGSFHSLRHTCCTLLLEDGIDLATVSRILGHEKASFTGDRYAHATARSKRRASASMARMFGAG